MMTPALKLIVRAGAGVNTIDVKAATAQRRARRQLPWQERDRRRRAGDRPDARARSADPRQRRGPARRQVEQEGVLEGARPVRRDARRSSAPAASRREVIVRAAAFGMTVVLWSRRFNGQDRALTAGRGRRARPRPAAQQTTIALAPSPAEVAARADVLTIHLRSRRRPGSSSTRTCSRRLRPGASSSTPPAPRSSTTTRSARAAREKQLRVGLDVFAIEPADVHRRLRRSDRPGARRLRHAPHRRVHRSGAGSDRRRDRQHRRRRTSRQESTQCCPMSDAMA